MNELKVFQHKDGETLAKCEALELHFRLKADIEIAGNAIVDFAESLKTMRDKKLFAELGYATFGEYTKNEHKIEERQAYNYINSYEELGKEFLQSNANLGITKLQLLASADWSEREQIIENNNIEDMSVAQLKAALAEVENLKQQLSFLQDNPVTVEKKAEFLDIQAVESEIRREQHDIMEDKYRTEIDNLQAKADRAMSDDELQKYKDNAIKEAKAAAADDVKKLKAELKAAMDISEKKDAMAKQDNKARLDAEARAKVAEEKAQKAAEDIQRVSELEAKVKAAELEKAAVEKKIKLAADPELARFKFVLESWRSNTSALAVQLTKLDEEWQAKMRAAIKAVMEDEGL